MCDGWLEVLLLLSSPITDITLSSSSVLSQLSSHNERVKTVVKTDIDHHENLDHDGGDGLDGDGGEGEDQQDDDHSCSV